MNLNNLHCIDLDMTAVEGFRKFVSCWLYHSAECTFVVDPGPLSTMPHLLAELNRYGVETLDYILLTHIHIDHAGGTGALVKQFPSARVICHPKGISHMVDPEQLWQGSQKVLGELAAVYGEIMPVPQENIGYADRLDKCGVRVFQTPGHAVHHCCYLFDDLLFGGEVAGVHAPIEDGIYMRPATPPRFLLEVALDSLQRMIDLQPRYLVIAHYGLVEPAADYLRIASGQLQLWVRGIAQLSRGGESPDLAKVLAWLLEHDAYYRNQDRLDPDLVARELYFIGNSIKGMSEYVNHLPEDERQALVRGEGERTPR
ncbi:MAG: MBL fold metallo-hydrolase [Desulfuromonas sp.]|nr:MAG: MBL fold metallo-hydrolase [Desulfuromonas sp.]